MPITISPLSSDGAIGPGVFVGVSSDYSGQLGPDAFFTVGVLNPPLNEAEAWLVNVPSQSLALAVQLYDPRLPDQILTTNTLADDASVELQAKLFATQGDQVDSGVITAPWTNTQGLTNQQRAFAEISSQGGFTDSDRAILTQVQGWVVANLFVTQMLETSIGLAPPGGTVAAQLPNPIYGVLVRMTQIAPELTTTTPDDDYWVKTIASVRIFKGSDILHRIPIHRSSQIIPFFGTGMSLQVSELWFSEWAAGLSVQVAFLDGCAGEVFLLTSP